MGIDAALQDVRSKNCGAVPAHLRDAHYKGAAKLGHGTEYIYPHDYPGHFTEQAYLPKEIQNAHYYQPSDNGQEKRMGDYLRKCWPDRF
jgi:putative ATPase